MSKVDWSKAPDDAEFYANGVFWMSPKLDNYGDSDGCLDFWHDDVKSWGGGVYNLFQIAKAGDFERRPIKLDKQPRKHNDGNKYHREIIGFCGTMVEVDVYRVLDAFKTESPAIDHAVKKMLCTGIRGHKDYLTDIDNAIESLQAAKLLYLQKKSIDEV